MQNLRFLNSKDKKDFTTKLRDMYGFSGDIPGHLLLSSKDKFYLVEDSEVLRNGLDKNLRIDRAGLKIATETLGGMRLNIEGSQLLGPHLKKRILELDENHVESLVKGEDFFLSDRELELAGKTTGLYILKHGNNFLGSGIVKEGRLLNQLSKIRRVKNFNR